jgi:hypothetical protein
LITSKSSKARMTSKTRKTSKMSKMRNYYFSKITRNVVKTMKDVNSPDGVAYWIPQLYHNAGFDFD